MKGNPFFLDEEGENWVLDTWKNMSLEQKCGQVFCPMGFNGEEETLKHFTQDIRWVVWCIVQTARKIFRYL